MIFPDALAVGPGDDAAVFKFPDTEGTFVAKMESHCSPCVPRPYDAATTRAGGAMGETIAVIPNRPLKGDLEELTREA